MCQTKTIHKLKRHSPHTGHVKIQFQVGLLAGALPSTDQYKRQGSL